MEKIGNIVSHKVEIKDFFFFNSYDTKFFIKNIISKFYSHKKVHSLDVTR